MVVSIQKYRQKSYQMAEIKTETETCDAGIANTKTFISGLFAPLCRQDDIKHPRGLVSFIFDSLFIFSHGVSGVLLSGFPLAVLFFCLCLCASFSLFIDFSPHHTSIHPSVSFHIPASPLTLFPSFLPPFSKFTILFPSLTLSVLNLYSPVSF